MFHWVTLTNRNLVFCKSVNNAQLFVTLTSFCYFLGLFCLILHYRKKIVFGTFWQHILILFFAVTQCNKQNSVCCSGSVPQIKIVFVAVTLCDKQYWKKYPISLFHVRMKWRRKKKKKKTSIQIWISPALSNCFWISSNQLSRLKIGLVFFVMILRILVLSLQIAYHDSEWSYKIWII